MNYLYNLHVEQIERDALIKMLDLLNASDMRLLTAYIEGYERGRADEILKDSVKKDALPCGFVRLD